MKLLNRVALVTGGARIGVVVAEKLAEQGCHVALVYRSSRVAAEQTATRVRNQGREAGVFRADLAVPSQAKALVHSVVRRFGRLDVLVNMASVYEKNGDWEKIFKANLDTAIHTSHYASPHLIKSKGRIINFADWVVASGRPRYKNYVPYYTAKMGVLGLTQALALELAPHVLVNAIAPGPILPPADASKEIQKEVASATPLARWGGPDEIAKAVLFLCDTEFVTGECIRVDGGRHLF